MAKRMKESLSSKENQSVKDITPKSFFLRIWSVIKQIVGVVLALFFIMVGIFTYVVNNPWPKYLSILLGLYFLFTAAAVVPLPFLRSWHRKLFNQEVGGWIKYAYVITSLLMAFAIILASSGKDSGSVEIAGFTIAVVKGPIVGGQVSVYEINPDGTKGKLSSGPHETGADGLITFESGSLPKNSILESKGGAYKDEATGQQVQLSSSAAMQAVIPQGMAQTAVTPFTHMASALASQLMKNGVPVSDAITMANQHLSQVYQIPSILELIPRDATDAEAVSLADADERTYSLLLASFAQSAKDKNINAIDLADALAKDWADGNPDGLDNGNPILVKDKNGQTTTLTSDAAIMDIDASADTFVKSGKTGINAELYLTVSGAKLNTNFRITTTALPTWIEGVGGSIAFTAEGGTLPYKSWSASGLPAGFGMSAQGVLSGTMTLQGRPEQRIPIRVSVIDSSGQNRTANFVLRIIASPPKINSGQLPYATAGNAYVGYTFSATRGYEPYKYKKGFSLGLTSGLPAGLYLSSNGVLKGTVNKNARTGTYTPLICVVDKVGSSDCNKFTLVVYAGPEEKKEPVGPGGSSVATVYVQKFGYAIGTVTTDPPGINCDVDCDFSEYAFPIGTEVKITVDAPEDFEIEWNQDSRDYLPNEFQGVIDTCKSISGPQKETCTVVVDGENSINLYVALKPILKSTKGSKECIVTGRDPKYPNYRDLRAIITGVVSGPVGTAFLGPDVVYDGKISFTCGSWAELPSEYEKIMCVRMKNDPPSTTWRIVNEVKDTENTEVYIFLPTMLSYNSIYVLSDPNTNAFPYAGSAEITLDTLRGTVPCPH